MRRMFARPFFFLFTVVALTLSMFTTTAGAASRVDSLPFVNNFATAKFKHLTTINIDGFGLQTYGEGAVVMPDRLSAWTTADGADTFVYQVQLGSTFYQRQDNGPWERTDGGSVNAQPMSAQMNELQAMADSIEMIGQEMVGGVSTDHYQVRVSGKKLLESNDGDIIEAMPAESENFLAKSTLVYDFWIGPEQFVYQQNSALAAYDVEIGGTTFDTYTYGVLITYYDINNPIISVNAPE